MKRPFRIERFQPSDMSEVLAIERAAFGEEAFSEDLFARYHAKHPASFLVARRGRVLGYSLAEQAGDEAELVSIAVAPAWRRRGVGRALLQATLLRLRRAGCRRCRLTVRTTNLAAIRLYETLGFQPVRRIRGYYADGADAWRMKKDLGASART